MDIINRLSNNYWEQVVMYLDLLEDILFKCIYFIIYYIILSTLTEHYLNLEDVY